jgi:hypothetical protein
MPVFPVFRLASQIIIHLCLVRQVKGNRPIDFFQAEHGVELLDCLRGMPLEKTRYHGIQQDARGAHAHHAPIIDPNVTLGMLHWLLPQLDW